ncbi:MAG: porin [Ignavibacteriaceae bacterium]
MSNNYSVKILIIFLLFSLIKIDAQSLSYKPGSGIKLSSDEQEWSFRLLGYVQSTFTYHKEKENESVRNSFFVRRARLDFIFDYLDKYEIFFELDGRGTRTELVLAQVDIEYLKNHKIEAGKFITPFSPENLRSSRGLSTVERYSAQNSLFLLPALDTQYGIMFFGFFEELNYYLSITNGNGKASDNVKEDNNPKDFQARLEYKTSNNFSFGGSVNYSEEKSQALKLVDHTFEAFNEVKINGKRFGYLADFEYNKNDLMFRGEIFQYHFNEDLSAENQLKKFLGIYTELGYFLNGNISDGIQLIGRFETAKYNGEMFSVSGPTSLNSYIIGTNWYMNNIFRFQVNLIYEKADSKSLLAGRFESKNSDLLLLTMLQLKF